MSAQPKLLPFRLAAASEVRHSSDNGGPVAGANGDAPARAALIDPRDQAQAEERLAILQPLLQFKFTAINGSAPTPKSDLVRVLCQLHRVSRTQLFEWQRRYREGGLPALADRKRNDKGKSRWFEEHPDAKFVAAAAYLKAAQSKVSAWEAVERWCDLQGIEPPDYKTVRLWLESPDLPAPVKIYAREGDRRLNERMLPYLQRKYTDVPANHIWVSDHMIHDTIVRNDCFPGDRENAPVRLRFTCIIDFRSRMVVGYSWTLDGSSRSIASALRMAIERYGACAIFYVDNGEDYKKVARGADYAWQRQPNAQFADDVTWMERLGVLGRLGIEIQHCLKYHPQSKHIERFFRTMHLRLDAVSEHYTTGNAYTRPEITDKAVALHNKLARLERVESSPLIPASEFIRTAIEWLEQDYNRAHSHRGRGMRGLSPSAIFEESCPASSRTVPDLSALDHLFWERASRRVRRGKIELDNTSWVAADNDSSTALYFAGESDVLIHFDPNLRDRALVTDMDGNAIARMVPETFATQSREAQPQIAASMQERRTLRNRTALAVRTIQKRAAEVGYVSAADDLRRRALASSAVDVVLTQPVRKPKPSDDARAPKSAADIAADFLRS